MFSTFRATTSHPRNLLSMARLNIAKSRTLPPTCSLVRIDQTCFGRSGGFAPVSLPLFQGIRLDATGVGFSLSSHRLLTWFSKVREAIKIVFWPQRGVFARTFFYPVDRGQLFHFSRAHH